MYKFNRQFLLRVTTSTQEIVEITNPLTCEFDVSRKNLASLNTATFTIYNLNELTRQKIFKDIFDLDLVRKVEFWAGYAYDKQTFLARCFAGEIKQAYSFRDGPDYKTVIDCWDAGKAAALGFSNQTMPAGTSIKDMVAKLIETMPNIIGATVSDQFDKKSARSTVLFGNQFDILSQITGGKFYVDSQQGFALKDDDAIAGDINLIDDKLGLLGTPRRSQSAVEVTMLFEPRFVVSQYCELQSTIEPIYNGVYKLTGIEHIGVISDAVSGECKTTVTLFNTNIKNVIKNNIINYLNK